MYISFPKDTELPLLLHYPTVNIHTSSLDFYTCRSQRSHFHVSRPGIWVRLIGLFSVPQEMDTFQAIEPEDRKYMQ